MRLAKKFSAATIALVAMAGIATPASADDSGTAPVLLSDTSIDWVAGGQGWMNLSWTAFEDLSDVKVTVVPQSNGIEISYPENHDGFTGLSVDSDLSSNEIDYTSFYVETTAANSGTKWAKVYVEWTQAGDGHQALMANLKFSNMKYKGDDFLILTDSVSVSSGETDTTVNWVEFGYKGLAPTNSDFSITVEGVAAEVYYPQDSFTSLHHDHVLNAGETDVARIWIDPALVAEGSSEIEVVVNYSNNSGRAQQVSHKVALTVD